MMLCVISLLTCAHYNEFEFDFCIYDLSNLGFSNPYLHLFHHHYISSDALHLQYNYGWKELAWVAQVSPMTFLYAGAAPRLRKASLVRNHQTPSDFITDMFQCQLLRYGVIIIQIVAQFIWMTSNVVAVKNSFNMAFNLDEDSPWM